MKIAIIGAASHLGSELLRAGTGEDVTGFARGDCDVTDVSSLEAALTTQRFDVVINLASYNRVDDSEADPAPAVAVNADGARNVARVAARTGAAVCYVSTDYVFGADTRRNTPYAEDDEPGPINAYGRSKLEGERLVRGANPEHLIVRTSGLFGATKRRGATFPEVMLAKAAAGGPIRVVDDQTVAPTYVPELAEKMIELLRAGARGIVHLSNSGGCTWYEFACEIFRQAGLSPDLAPISSEEFGAAATRPAYSVMTSKRLPELGIEPMSPWQDGVCAWLAGEERRRRLTRQRRLPK